MAYGQQWGGYPGAQPGYFAAPQFAPIYQPAQTMQAMPAMQSQPMQQAPALPPQQPQAAQQRTQPATVRIVANREEAMAAQIPFDATVNVFVNANAREVYVKRFNMQTGNADFDDYYRGPNQSAQQTQPQPGKQPEWATASALEETRAKLEAMAQEIEALRAAVGRKPGKGAAASD